MKPEKDQQVAPAQEPAPEPAPETPLIPETVEYLVPATVDHVPAAEPSTAQAAGTADATAGVRPGQHMGRYRIEKVLGQGGFGQVFLAWDEELHRRVAIKVATRMATADATEARTVARLDHPHIVPVHDVGRTEQGQLFIVSKLIEGRDLASCIKARRLPLEQSARLVSTIAGALHYAHEQGLVHRDVKPDNVLLDESGRPYVCDFGLALRDEDYGTGPQLAGTPAYMSPEQARREGHRVDRRTDVYSLGVILYELMTGERPFAGGVQEVLRLIAHEEVTPPRQRNPAVPAELERICLRCLAKRAADRYATAAELAAELQAFGQGGGAGGSQRVFKVVPRGLRSFDAADADFFLELLPGPRDARGLPESLVFWLNRLEETQAERTFSVGLLYGPSGCGKSSLVKAGLLPRLGERVRAVYVEATGQDTEARLLNGLRKVCPEVRGNLSLPDSLERLRRTGVRKVVLILDQFEQWLHARHEFAGTELVEALRQCDGVRVQAVVLVRDDFWLAVSRFLKELEVPLVEGHNSALVDLFDLLHARKVLAEFGRAYGRLPEDLTDLGPDQQRFLDEAVSGLARDGKVVSVRLALFAEMVKGKPWTRETLRQVGGTEGVGVTFLEETFSADSAPPEHRLHQKACRAVLQALLPEAGTEIKGHMRSRQELLQASGHAERPQAFGDVLRILDNELRLITPTDPQGLGEADAGNPAQPRDQLYYQLTHDYLVPALRRWLTRKQMETPRGRAELRLAERAALWNAKPENRRLPDWQEYVSIRRLTDRHSWTDSQRRMMHQAGRYHGQALVRRLLEANLAEVPELVRQLGQIGKFTEPLLRQEQQTAQEQSKAKLHTALALLTVDESQLDYLYQRLLQAAPEDFPILRDALSEHKEKLSARLWSDASSAASEERRLRAAAALASYDATHPHWQTIRPDVAQALTRVSPEFLGHWKEALRPVRAELLGPLSAIFRNHELGELQLALATSTLADYAADDVSLLADLLCDANPKQFAGLFPVLARHGEAAIRELEGELDKEVEPHWADSPADPAWQDVPAETRHAIEAAAGLVEERFALCQAMPREQFSETVEQLGKCGYRPLRIRPYFGVRRLDAALDALDGLEINRCENIQTIQSGGEPPHSKELVAAIWTRDGRPWQWLEDADAELVRTRDAELRRHGYAPMDVAVACRPAGSPCYSAVWEKADTADTEVRLVVGPLGEQEQQALATLVEEKFNCQIANAVFDEQSQPHGCSLWTRRKDQQKSTTRVFHGAAADFREDDCPGLLLTDAQLSRCEGQDDGAGDSLLLVTALWNVSTQFESKALHGLSPEAHLAQARRLIADGFRPVAISADGGSRTPEEVKR
jgi:hypothetical protein